MKQFPYPCCRCGFCCLSCSCPAAIRIYGVKKSDPCPGLTFDQDKATCGLAHLPGMGMGEGCCISARAFKDGKVFDFASLPEQLKIKAARLLREDD